ncbi:MAG: hypothetical protein V3V26_00845 [Candidatus Aenigmarchaeota archaeon]
MILTPENGFKRDYTIFAIDTPRTAGTRKFRKTYPFESGWGLISLNAKKDYTKVCRIHVPFESPDGRIIEIADDADKFFFGNLKQLMPNKNGREGVLDLYRKYEDGSNSNPSGGNVEIPLDVLDLDANRTGMVEAMVGDILLCRYVELLTGMELKTDRSMKRLPIPARVKDICINNGRAFYKKYKPPAPRKKGFVPKVNPNI